jgi:C1A family cysteine protease
MLYEEGVYDRPCSEANHAILIVGFDKTNDGNYWTIKNSWGNLWGEKGFMRIKQSNHYNSCLLNSYYVRPEL